MVTSNLASVRPSITHCWSRMTSCATFTYPDPKGKSWFPGHMAKGLREANDTLMQCHFVIEVHDARYIPNVGRNPNFTDLIRGRPHVLVLNKSDLCEFTRTTKFYKGGPTNFLLTNCKAQHDKSIKKLMRIIHESITDDSSACNVMVLGIPNVGKSSIINSLRRHFLKKGKAARCGPEPGVTRAVSQFIKIAESPRKVFLSDAPGILVPRIDSGETLVKLAAIGTLRDNLIGEELIVDFILYALNSKRNFKYTEVYGLDSPCFQVKELLTSVSKRLQAYMKGGLLDTSLGAKHFIKQFRNGKFGTITFD